MASYNLNKILKQKDLQEKHQEKHASDKKEEVALDDSQRVKILSPMQQVFKRFFRNRLAMTGLAILIIMFLFSFVAPLFYPYGQKEVFRKYESQHTDYALAKNRTEFTSYVLDDTVQVDRTVANKTNSNINSMVSTNQTAMQILGSDGEFYELGMLEENIYRLDKLDTAKVASFGSVTHHVGLFTMMGAIMEYDQVDDLGEEFVATCTKSTKGNKGTFEFDGQTYTYEKGSAPKTYDIYVTMDSGFSYAGAAQGADFESAALAAAESGEHFTVGSNEYFVYAVGEGGYDVYSYDGTAPAMIYTRYAFDAYETGATFSDEFKVSALQAVPNGDSFEFGGATYSVIPGEDSITINDAEGNGYAEMSTFVIRRYNGADTMELGLKDAIRETVEELQESGKSSTTIQYRIPQQTEDGKYSYDEEGNLLYDDNATLTITRKDVGEYLVNADQIILLIDMYASPSSTHLFGTDSDGFDVLARMMYGGRISLMVGFIVVFLETLLGVIMGGLAGYFGGWVDNLIMRLVDIFYCLPMMPIMIIVGTMMDALRMDTYVRLAVMMAALGIMGWAGVARLVRGQILSLREQEFMVATEATGVRISRRIFRHLVPNVMPQLIVSATMGLGGTILTESTLSFLGLGVKHPLATWGTMINSVSTATAMTHYTHIWIPVGLLICLTVIAFNFVGDGLRDAFDPKGKR